MPSPSLLQTLRTPRLWRRRLRAHQPPLVFLRFPHCGGRSIVQALEAAGHTVASTLSPGSPANQKPTAGPATEAAEAIGLDFSQLSGRSDAELQQLILPKGSTLTCLSYSLPSPGVLARCCPGARVFSVVGDPVGRLVVA